MTDWTASLGNRQRWLDRLAWAGSAAAVLLAVLASAAIAMQLQATDGIRAARDSVILLDLPPSPAAPAMTALADPGPDVPQPDAPQGFAAPDATPGTAPPRPAKADALPRLDSNAPQITPPLPPDAAAVDTAVPPPPVPVPVPVPVPEPEPAQKPDAKPKPAAKAVAKPKATSAPALSKAADAPKSAAQPGPAGKASAAMPKGKIRDLVARWGASVRTKVQKRNGYPIAAKGAQGSVTLHLTLRRDGSVQSVSIAASSGSAVLDAAALAAVARAGPLPAAPNDLTGASYGFSLALTYQR